MELRDGKWPRVVFTPDEIERAKIRRIEKDGNGWDNLWTVRVTDRRFCGELGEDAFECWLKHRGVDYQRWTRQDQKDSRDFTIGLHEIDVKAIAAKHTPLDHYGAQVEETQVLKNSVVNVYLFGRFVMPESTLILMGWLEKPVFKAVAKIRERGEQVTASFAPPARIWEVAISDLRALDELFEAPSDYTLDYFLKVMNV